MNKEVTLNDNDLEKANGGTHFVKTWICPVCVTKYPKGHFPEYKEENSIAYFKCTECNQWYPKNDWKHINYR